MTTAQAVRARFLLLFLPLAALVLGVAGILAQFRVDAEIDRLATASEADVRAAAAELSSELDRPLRHLLSLPEESAIQAAIGLPVATNLRRMEEGLTTLLSRNFLYDQARWIDETGQERVRVDQGPKGPRLVEELGGLSEPWQLAHAPLIHDDMMGKLPGMPTWGDWLEAAGVKGVDLSRGLHFSSPDHALEAACEGAGVLLAQRVLAFEDLRNGRLIAPFHLELPSSRSFRVVCPAGHQNRPKIKALTDWLDVEVRMMKSSPYWPKAGTADADAEVRAR